MLLTNLMTFASASRQLVGTFNDENSSRSDCENRPMDSLKCENRPMDRLKL